MGNLSLLAGTEPPNSGSPAAACQGSGLPPDPLPPFRTHHPPDIPCQGPSSLSVCYRNTGNIPILAGLTPFNSNCPYGYLVLNHTLGPDRPIHPVLWPSLVSMPDPPVFELLSISRLNLEPTTRVWAPPGWGTAWCDPPAHYF